MPGPEGIEGQKVSRPSTVSFALYKHNLRPEGSDCTSSLDTHFPQQLQSHCPTILTIK